MRLVLHLFLIACLTLGVVSCADQYVCDMSDGGNFPTLPDDGDLSDTIMRQVSIVASAGTSAQSRINHQDNAQGISVTWAQGDAIKLYSSQSKGAMFTLREGANTKSGIFGGTIANNTYTAMYPAFGRGVSTPFATTLFSVIGQEQQGNGTMGHLSEFNYMKADNLVINADGPNYAMFNHQVVIMKFTITPPEACDPTYLTFSTDGQLTESQTVGGNSKYCHSVPLGISGVTLSEGGTLLAYMILYPFTMDVGKSMYISLTASDGKTYSFKNTASSNRRYEAGKRYSATLTQSSMSNQSSEFSNDTKGATSFGGGDGSQSNPYLITTASELKKLVLDIDQTITYVDTYFMLTTDINVTADVWIPIGNFESPFCGHFDGAGHTIDGRLFGSNSTFGFFGSSGGSIVNLHILADVTNNYTSSESWTGGVVGMVSGNVMGCTVSGDVKHGGSPTSSGVHTYTGGIVGYGDGSSYKIAFCKVSGNVIGGNTARGNSYTGGIGGYVYHTIDNSTVTGNVIGGHNSGKNANSTTGGIVGYGRTIANCRVVNEIIKGGDALTSCTGGVAGEATTSITSCEVLNGDLSIDPQIKGGDAKTVYTGGLQGLCAMSTIQIHDSRNSKPVMASVATTTIRCGGLVGSYVSGSVYDCSSNTATVGGMAATDKNRFGVGSTKTIVKCTEH